MHAATDKFTRELHAIFTNVFLVTSKITRQFRHFLFQKVLDFRGNFACAIFIVRTTESDILEVPKNISQTFLIIRKFILYCSVVMIVTEQKFTSFWRNCLKNLITHVMLIHELKLHFGLCKKLCDRIF